MFEPLESRLMYSTTFTPRPDPGELMPQGIALEGGVLCIKGGSTNDSAQVSIANGMVSATLGKWQQAPLGGGWFHLNEYYLTLEPSLVQSIRFYGMDGNDDFTNNTSIRCIAIGDGGADHLVGGYGSDTLYGAWQRSSSITAFDGSADTLEGRGGNDMLVGGAGGDTYVYASSGATNFGADTITESSNVDEDWIDFSGVTLSSNAIGLTVQLDRTSIQYALSGTTNLSLTLSDATAIENVRGTTRGDNIAGNSRSNRLEGGMAGDTLRGSGGSDIMFGGAGNDNIGGEMGSDYIFGDAGNDLIHGGAGSDFTYGGADSDVLYADQDGDWMYGDGGDDRLIGATGVDHLFGGDNNDTLVAIGGGQSDELTGGTGVNGFWLDAGSSEKILDAADAARVHRVSSFYSCRIQGTDLGAPSRELIGQALADPVVVDPVNHVYQNFASNPLFASNGPMRDDIDQNGIADCYFMSTLASVAQTNPDKVRQLVVDLGDGTYAVNFKSNSGQDVFVRVDGDLPAKEGKPVYAGLGLQNSLWVAIMEKAWAFYRDENGVYADAGYWQKNKLHLHDDFKSLGLKVEKDTAVSALLDGTILLNTIKNALSNNMGAYMTGPNPFTNSSTGGHSDAHAYTIVSVNTGADGKSTLTIRNPYAGDQYADGGYTTISAEQAFARGGTLIAFSLWSGS